MSMSPSLQRELVFLVAWLMFTLTIGAMLGLAMIVMFVGLLGYVVWHLYHLNQLLKWLSKPSKSTPEAIGVWDEAFFKLHQQHKRQKKSRKKLTKMLKLFQKSTKALPYASIVLNSNNIIKWFNPASKKLFGLRSGLDVGQRIDNLIRQPEFRQYLNLRQFEVPLEFDIQQQKILLNVTPYGNGQYLLSARDITQQTKLDEMRRDFISNASHELRTPLTVMTGYIETLQGMADDSIKYPVDKIFLQTVRMESIIRELIELAKLETAIAIGDNETIDINELMNEVYNEAISFDQGKHEIELNILPIVINGRSEEIRIAVSNLLTNAIRYTPDGGVIKLYTSSDKNGSFIHVEDNGIGISYEHISRLTERFYRVDEGRSRAVGGTGLGLAIVQQIMEHHKAKLQINSVPNEGSVFSCCFPVI